MRRGFTNFHGLNTSALTVGRLVWRGGVECFKFLLLLALVMSLANCGFFSYQGGKKSYVIKGRRYYILNSAQGFRERGLASWYGEPFHGRRTASGEVYDMDRISAAHKTLPLHTWVEVRNLENDQVLTVRINDRGPFISGRVIDLSRAAAKRLGVYGPGVAKVRLRAITGRRARQLAAVGQGTEQKSPAQNLSARLPEPPDPGGVTTIRLDPATPSAGD